MGLSRSSIAFLMAEAARRPFSGRILMLGLQGILITEEEIEEVAREQGVQLRPPPQTVERQALQPGLPVPTTCFTASASMRSWQPTSANSRVRILFWI